MIYKYNVGSNTLLQEVLFGNEFYGDLVYKFGIIDGKTYSSVQVQKIVTSYKKIGYNMDSLRQTAYMVVNPIMVDNFASLFNNTIVDRSTD